jgi:hypothetical protein
VLATLVVRLVLAALVLLVRLLLAALVLLVLFLAAALLLLAGTRIVLTRILIGIVRIAHSHHSSRVQVLPPPQEVNARRRKEFAGAAIN